MPVQPEDNRLVTPTEWDEIDADKYLDEEKAVSWLLSSVEENKEAIEPVAAEAAELVRLARARAKRQGVVESFLQEFSLSTPEGLALMGLAEALLRTPDTETKSRLIAERIGPADWQSHLGNSESLFVNASTWALMLTSKWGGSEQIADRSGVLRRLVARLGEPVVRVAVAQAIRIMGQQFVLGTNIGLALGRARKESLLCSFYMLG